MGAAPHRLHGHHLLAILLALHVVLHLARQAFGLGEGHGAHHSLNAREAPVEDNLSLVLFARHRFLNPREGVPPQLLHLLLQQDQVRLVEQPAAGILRLLLLCRRRLLLSLALLGALAHGGGDVGGVRRRRIPGVVVARARHLVVRVFKSAVQVGIIFVHAARVARVFFSDFIGIKSGLSHIKIAAFAILFVSGARVGFHHLCG